MGAWGILLRAWLILLDRSPECNECKPSWYVPVSSLECMYHVLFQIIDVNHGCAELAATDVPTAISLMQVDFISREVFETVGALLHVVVLNLFLHFTVNDY